MLAYGGEACVTKESVEDFRSKSVSTQFFGLLSDESEGNSEGATGNTFKVD